MAKIKKELVQRAIKKAKQSSATYAISAVGISKKGEVICTAFNKSRFMRKGGGLHSEMNVMLKGGPGVKTIIICRVGRSGNLLPVSPCEVCASTAKRLGIKILSVGL